MIIGSNIIFHKNLASTNTYAALLLKKEKPPEGTIIYTNFQSAGRGQKGNTWESEDGKNLLFSIILFPEMIRPEKQFCISMAVSLGICDFLKGLIPVCKIKWPNDIYAGDDKIAGILIENSIIGSSIESTVAGIGLNINQVKFPAFLPNPVSLKLITGIEHDPYKCLKDLAAFLDRRYKKLVSGETDEIKEEYVSSLYHVGEWYDYKTAGDYLHGRIISVTDSGCLQIQDEKMVIRQFSFKEIEFIP